MNYNEILNHIPEATIVTDREGKVLYHNNASEIVFGKEFSDLKEQFSEEKLLGLLEKPLIEVDFKTIKKVTLLVNSSHDSDGKVIFTMKDISIIAAIEKDKEKQRADQSHQKVTLEKRTMVNDFAHEVNNPLFILNGNFYLLKRILKRDQVLNEQTEKLLNVMGETIERIASVIDDKRELTIFDFSDPSENINLKDRITECTKLVEVALEMNGVEVVLDSSLDVQVHVQLDMLRSSILELLNNSIFFLERRKVESPKIEIKCVKKSDTEFAVEFCDSGPPIIVDDTTQLFEPFYTTKSSNEGSGVGLFQVKSILQEFGHDICYNEKSECVSFHISVKGFK